MPDSTKTLLLVRHAQAAWQDAGAADRHRPLDLHGEQQAARLRQWAAASARRPGLIVSSPAVHAADTARALAEGFALPPGCVVTDERLYHGSAHAWAQLLDGLDDSRDCAVLVAHNPQVSDLCRHFWPAIDYLPTGGVAELQFRTDRWAGLLARRAQAGRLPMGPAAGLPARVLQA